MHSCRFCLRTAVFKEPNLPFSNNHQYRCAKFATPMTDVESDKAEVHFFVAGEPERAQRLDRGLTTHFPNESRSSIQRWIDEGLVMVNGKTAKAGYRVEPGDSAEVRSLPRSTTVGTLQPTALALSH